MISVLHWGSHPDLDNDDCFSGDDFDTVADAIKFYLEDPPDSSVEYVEIDLSDETLKLYNITRLRKNPNFRPRKKRQDSDADWRREMAMQAGMEMGIGAYNDYMGYDSEEPPDSWR